MNGPWSVRYPTALPPSHAVAMAEGFRYGVPRSLVEAATRRRRTGDWRGACLVADVDIAFDPADVYRRHGQAVATDVLDDLRELAPDLLRWHLPRYGHGCGLLRESSVVPLADYGGPGTSLTLAALTPRAALDAGQRVVLALVPDRASLTGDPVTRQLCRAVRWASAARHDLRLHRERWHASDAEAFIGKGAGPGVDTFCRDERSPAPPDAGELAAAWAAAGAPPRDGDPHRAGRAGEQRRRALRRAAQVPVDLGRLFPEIRRVLPGEPVVALRPGGGLAVLVEGLLAGVPTVRFVPASAARDVPVLPDAAWRQRPEADLVRLGLLHPDELHPLVGPSVPGAAPGSEAVLAVLDRPHARVAVRCLDRDHHVELVDGRWTAVDHDQDGPAAARERLLVRLGAPASPCAQVVADLMADRVLVGHVEGLLAHGRTDDVLRAIRQSLGERTEPAAVRLSDGGNAAAHLDRLRDARLALRLLLCGVTTPARTPLPPPRPRPADPADALDPTRRRRSRKGDPARTHR